MANCETTDRNLLRREDSLAGRILDRLFAFVGVLAPDGTLLDANAAPRERRIPSHRGRANPAHERLWGGAAREDGATPLQRWKGWWPPDSARAGAALEPGEWPLARALAGTAVAGELVDIEPFDAAGARRTLVVSAALVRDATGAIAARWWPRWTCPAWSRPSARRQSEAQFAALADNIAQLAWMTDASGFIYWYSRRWFEYTGATLAAMQGLGWRAAHHPEHLTRVEAKLGWSRLPCKSQRLRARVNPHRGMIQFLGEPPETRSRMRR